MCCRRLLPEASCGGAVEAASAGMGVAAPVLSATQRGAAPLPGADAMSAVDPTVHHARVGVSIDRNTLHGGLLATERWYNPVVTVAAAGATTLRPTCNQSFRPHDSINLDTQTNVRGTKQQPLKTNTRGTSRVDCACSSRSRRKRQCHVSGAFRGVGGGGNACAAVGHP